MDQLVDVREPSTGYTIIGGGKTGSDACTWLLGQGVDPDRIRWVRARDAWMWNRAQVQPLDLVTDTVDGLSRVGRGVSRRGHRRRSVRAARIARPTAPARSRGLADHVPRGHVDPRRARGPAFHRAASSDSGTSRPSTPTRSSSKGARSRATAGQLFVDCSAAGLGKAPARPIFEPGRITVQCVSTLFPTFNAAVIGYIEGSRGDDLEAKARLAPTNRYPDAATDWIPNMRGQLRVARSVERAARHGGMAGVEPSQHRPRHVRQGRRSSHERCDHPAPHVHATGGREPRTTRSHRSLTPSRRAEPTTSDLAPTTRSATWSGTPSSTGRPASGSGAPKVVVTGMTPAHTSRSRSSSSSIGPAGAHLGRPFVDRHPHDRGRAQLGIGRQPRASAAARNQVVDEGRHRGPLLVHVVDQLGLRRTARPIGS